MFLTNVISGSYYDAQWAQETNIWNALDRAIDVAREGSSFLSMIAGHMPTVIGSCVLMVAGVAIIKLIVGR